LAACGHSVPIYVRIMRVTDEAKALMRKHEGFREKAYLCPAEKWTIGYGNTFYENGQPVREGHVIDRYRAERLFSYWVDEFAKGVTRLLGGKRLNENQFSAVVSFCYNVGLGSDNPKLAGGFTRSTLRRKILANPNDPAIAAEFKRWTRAGGKVLNGLVTRRREESQLYFKP